MTDFRCNDNNCPSYNSYGTCDAICNANVECSNPDFIKARKEMTWGSFTKAYADGYQNGLKDARSTLEWTPCNKKENLPESGKHVLLSCKTDYGTEYVCDGFYASKFSIECGVDCEIDSDYNEENDEFFLPEGYYEVIKNWGDYSSIVINDAVLAWQPLPATLPTLS